jgi:hypothetical protein
MADLTHAVENATGWLETIDDQLARLKTACAREQPLEDYDRIRDEILESPLSVEVRSDWASVGATLSPSEFCILLSTGGPALRIVGTLGRFNAPENSRLEVQDWGTPWTEVPAASATLDAWSAQFYFGD